MVDFDHCPSTVAASLQSISCVWKLKFFWSSMTFVLTYQDVRIMKPARLLFTVCAKVGGGEDVFAGGRMKLKVSRQCGFHRQEQLNKFSTSPRKISAISATFLSVFLLCAQCGAEEKSVGGEAAQKRSLSESIEGVVTGQLVTVTGNIFFQYFTAHWRDQPLSERYSITVHERPSAIRGNQIRIECLNRTVFLAILPNSRGDLKGFAERAAAIVYQNASEADVQRMLFRDTDLAPDEL